VPGAAGLCRINAWKAWKKEKPNLQATMLLILQLNYKMRTGKSNHILQEARIPPGCLKGFRNIPQQERQAY
jgi:hypothetical protein